MSDQAVLVVAGTLCIREERLDEALERLGDMRAATLAEDGCLSYSFYRAPGSDSTLFVFEEWTGQAALDAHLATDHTRDFGRFLHGALAEPMAVSRYFVDDIRPLFDEI
jgi:quinol monooxygenase YgiN